MRTKLAPLLVCAALAGCAGTTTYSATVVTSPTGVPDMVTVSPGVAVIADYDVPIFYSRGYYWYNDGVAWYRSPRYTGGWVYSAPTHQVAAVRYPYRYAYYRPAGYVPRYRPVSSYYVQRPYHTTTRTYYQRRTY